MTNNEKEVIPEKKIRGVKFFNTKDVADILGLSIISARIYLRDGKLPGGLKIGGVWYISNKNLDKWLNKDIFSKPPAYILSVIKEEIEESYKKNLESIEKKCSDIIDKKIKEIQALKKI